MDAISYRETESNVTFIQSQQKTKHAPYTDRMSLHINQVRLIETLPPPLSSPTAQVRRRKILPCREQIQSTPLAVVLARHRHRKGKEMSQDSGTTHLVLGARVIGSRNI